MRSTIFFKLIGFTKFLLFISCLLFSHQEGFCQYANDIIKKLASSEFQGRGYYKHGDSLAAAFIKSEFVRIGLEPVKGNYYQPFTFPVNTFPGKMDVRIGKKKLEAGKDYIVSPACSAIKGKYNLHRVTFPLKEYSMFEHGNDFLVLDKTGLDSALAAAIDSIARFPPETEGVIIAEEKKLTWSVSGKVNDQAYIRIFRNAIPDDAKTISLNIENKFYPEYRSNNVIGMVRGTQYPDSFIVFTAHYDHLGRMGKKALFAGANDNASGTAMILDLAQYYSKPENRPPFSILFIAFAGEEAGLIGSRFYTENPLLPLEKIRFLINLDLMGNGVDGVDGVMVVNGEIHEKEFNILDSLNKDQKLVKEIGKRGKARNSDHYYFSERGVPAFFLYTQGGSKAYHDIYDVPSAIKLEEFEDIKLLLREFVAVLMK